MIRPSGIFLWLFSLAAILGALSPAMAQSSKELVVVIKPVEPFVFTEGKKPSGYSIDLWEEAARNTGVQYRYKQVQTIPEMLEELASGKADVAVGALSINSQREKVIDFTHPIYESGLGLLVRAQSGAPDYLAALLRPGMATLLLVLICALVLNAHLIWFFEHPHNEEFPKNYWHGIGEAFWYALMLLIVLGTEKSVVRWPTRVAQLIWVVVGVTLFSYVTASFASAMTVSQLNSDIAGLESLKSNEVGTLKDSQSETFLKTRGFNPVRFDNLTAALKGLEEDKIRAVCYDLPMLKYQLKENPREGFAILPVVYEPHSYGFGLQKDSPYRKELNLGLLEAVEDGQMTALHQKWFGKDNENNE